MKFSGDAKGNVKKLHAVRVGPAPKFETQKGTEFDIEADLVLLAMGFMGPVKNGMLEEFGVALDGRGNVVADPNTWMTSVPGIFAAGDTRRGQSLVVWAIAEGRKAARGVEEFLMGPSSSSRFDTRPPTLDESWPRCASSIREYAESIGHPVTELIPGAYAPLLVAEESNRTGWLRRASPHWKKGIGENETPLRSPRISGTRFGPATDPAHHRGSRRRRLSSASPGYHFRLWKARRHFTADSGSM